MSEMNTQLDPVMEQMQIDAQKDKELVEPVLQEVLNLLSDKLNVEGTEFKIKHGYTVVGKALVYLSQALCKSVEQFESEITEAQGLAVNRLVPALLPHIENGRIAEEGYDLENLSVRRIMMALGAGVDYVLWRTDMSNYQKERESIEVQEKVQEKVQAQEAVHDNVIDINKDNKVE